MQIAEPIIALTRKYARFKWSDTHQKPFEFLKHSFIAVPLLVYPHPKKLFVLYTGASDSCIGCDGDEKPIYYLSHKHSVVSLISSGQQLKKGSFHNSHPASEISLLPAYCSVCN